LKKGRAYKFFIKKVLVAIQGYYIKNYKPNNLLFFAIKKMKFDFPNVSSVLNSNKKDMATVFSHGRIKTKLKSTCTCLSRAHLKHISLS